MHNAEELQRAFIRVAKLSGINNRNLSILATPLQTSLDLKADIPADRLIITKSGILITMKTCS
ncbi:MAG TPA: hypothetical protein VIF37_00860 [Methylobacter sp.]